MKRKLYQLMASTIDARLTCIVKNSTEWIDNHTDTLNKLLDKLPSGSGLDNEWHYDIKHSTGNKILLSSSFHTMNEDGYYDGWIDFKIRIEASLINEIKLSITGNFGKYQDIRDYLYDILHYALTSEIEY
jgi:hypothetical protein